LDLEGLRVVQGDHDPLFDVHSAVVVRPDRYIFGVVDADWKLDRLLSELARKMCLEPGDRKEGEA
jgi:hypothetical protein